MTSRRGAVLRFRNIGRARRRQHKRRHNGHGTVPATRHRSGRRSPSTGRPIQTVHPWPALFRIRPGSIGIHTRSSRNGTTLAPVNVHDVHLMARPPTGTAGASGGGGTCSETPETDWFWGTGPPASVDPVPLLPDQEAPKEGLGGPSNLWGGSAFPSSQRPTRGAVPSPQVSLHGQLFPGMMNGSRHTTPQYEARRENGRSLAGPGLEQQLPRGPGLAPYHEAPFLAVELP